MIVLDFETHGIQKRPEYPPEPVGLAVRHEDGTRQYFSWGHPTRNGVWGAGTSRADLSARRHALLILQDAWCGNYGPVLFHNAAFDVEVAQVHFGLHGWPVEYHDTLFLAFLNDPRAVTLSLKPQAEKWCGIKPAARDALFEWLAKHVPEVAKNPKRAGEFIWRAPGDLVGRYAMTDVQMTYKLWRVLTERVAAAGMSEAYLTELALAPILNDMERCGIRVDVPRLKKLQGAMVRMLGDLDIRIFKRLGQVINLDSPAQLGKTLKRKGLLKWTTETSTGKQSAAMDVLRETCKDQNLVEMLGVRSAANKYLTTFIEPWVAQAERCDGRLLPSFSQVRNSEDERRGIRGTRTGRLSCADPNLQQIPADVDESKNAETLRLMALWLGDYGVPKFLGLRDYFLPDPGKLWASLDYNQQEVRILAHWEQGALCALYNSNPHLDVHSDVRKQILDRTGLDFPRKFVKTVVFGLLYGMGVPKLAAQLGIPEEDARTLRDAVLDVLPGVKKLMKQCSAAPTITTLGGRIYPVETRVVEDRDGLRQKMSFAYKQLNYRIQGSAADQTKQAMLAAVRLNCGRLALQVHDELVFMVDSRKDANRLARAMESIALNVPVVVEPKLSAKTWARVK